METFKPISCSRICSNVLIVLENECLFALRSSCPQTLKLHSSCQITWQFVILIFDPLSLPRQSRRIWHPGKKKRKKRKKEDSSIAFHFAASADCTQETQRWMDRAAVASWLQGFLLLCSSPSARLQLSQKSSKKLKKKKGSMVLMCLKEGNKTRQKKVNKVYKAILTGNTSDS